MSLDIRQVCSPAETKTFDTSQMRENYLIEALFQEDELSLVYSHLDRTIAGSAVPVDGPLKLTSSKQIGSENFLDRREIGVFNIGGEGIVVADGETFPLSHKDGLYLPMGTVDVAFASLDTSNPARFYLISTPAHHRYKAVKIALEDANVLELGTQSDANIRTLRQYIHPEICDSCQLVMGITTIADGSVWNTMPCHTHDRRSEVYLYFDMAEDTRVFHLMGEPDETRHLVVGCEEAILSPGWSIHSGAGTGSYSFIWSMGGDNQDFNDMDFVKMSDLK